MCIRDRAFGGTAYLLNNKLSLLTEAQIIDFENQNINFFERWPTTQRSESFNKASDVLLYSSQIIPGVLTLVDKSMRKDFLKIGVLYSQTFIVNLGLTAFVKNTARRARPFVYNTDVPIDEKMTKSARTSFYSGHTSETAAMCFLTARLYADYNPKSKWKPLVWTLAAITPAVTGYMRMRAGKHFPTDVAVGYAMGASVGYFLPKIHWRKKGLEETTFKKHF